jgi:hypothetical protein
MRELYEWIDWKCIWSHELVCNFWDHIAGLTIIVHHDNRRLKSINIHNWFLLPGIVRVLLEQNMGNHKAKLRWSPHVLFFWIQNQFLVPSLCPVASSSVTCSCKESAEKPVYIQHAKPRHLNAWRNTRASSPGVALDVPRRIGLASSHGDGGASGADFLPLAVAGKTGTPR